MRLLVEILSTRGVQGRENGRDISTTVAVFAVGIATEVVVAEVVVVGVVAIVVDEGSAAK